MLIVPAVMFLEMAKDALGKRDPAFIASQIREFGSLGPQREAEITASLPPGTSIMGAGYLLGVETARAILALTGRAGKAINL